MLKDFLVNFTKQYHELGHTHLLLSDTISNSEGVNKMIDQAAGFGHRLKVGHNFDGLLHSIEIDGIKGASTWFDHMLKDFTSHDGIPLPGAMFIKDITGMDFDEAVNWLTINASDVIELGVSSAAITLLEKKLANKPQLKNVALAVSGCIGIIDDNPLLVAYATIKAASEINKKFKFVSNANLEKFKVGSRVFYRGVKIVSVGTFFSGVVAQAFFDLNIVDFVTDVSIHALDGITILGEKIGIISDLSDHGSTITDAASNMADICEGVATLGLGIALSYSVKSIFKYFNKGKQELITILSQKVIIRKQIKEALIKQLPPTYILGYITEGIKKECYQPLLLLPGDVA